MNYHNLFHIIVEYLFYVIIEVKKRIHVGQVDWSEFGKAEIVGKMNLILTRIVELLKKGIGGIAAILEMHLCLPIRR